MTIVVTGATGHVGANLVRTLLGQGERVRVVVNRSRLAIEGLDVEIVEGNVSDAEQMKRALDGARLLFHVAALISIDGDPHGRVWKTNRDGARTVATAAREVGVERMVHFSSSHVFDHRRPGEIDENSTRVRPQDEHGFAYDRSKSAGEAAVREQIALGLDAVIVHPSGVVGPNDFGPSRFGRAIRMMARGHLPAMTPGGYDWVDVRDVVGSVIAAAERGRTGQSYLLTGRYATIEEVATRVAAITGKRAPLITVPLGLARAVAPAGAAIARKLSLEPLFTTESLAVLMSGVRFNNDLARRELGHEPRELGTTLADTLRWFHDAGQL